MFLYLSYGCLCILVFFSQQRYFFATIRSLIEESKPNKNVTNGQSHTVESQEKRKKIWISFFHRAFNKQNFESQIVYAIVNFVENLLERISARIDSLEKIVAFSSTFLFVINLTSMFAFFISDK